MREFKIRASAVSEIMGGATGLTEVQKAKLTELQTRKADSSAKPLTPNMENELSELIYKRNNPELPQGAKTYLKSWLKRELYHRDAQWKNIVIEKGLQVENDGIELVSEVYGLFNVEKNDEYFENEYMQGSPDVIHDGVIRDIKSSWDLQSFPMFEDKIPDNGYWWQLQQYMILTKHKQASLDYVLIDTPQALIEQDLKKLYYQSGGKAEDWTPETYEQMYPNYRFDDIPTEKRVKSFTFELDTSIEDKIIERVKLCREYLKKLI